MKLRMKKTWSFRSRLFDLRCPPKSSPLSQIIKRTCRADDIVARLGGDEFVILPPKTSAYDTDILVKRIKAELQDEQIMGIPISLSFGHETKTQEQETIYGVLNLAEDHMYHHKLSEASSIKSKNVDLLRNVLCAIIDWLQYLLAQQKRETR